MRSAAYGLGWHVVQRHRFGLLLLGGGLVALVGLRQIPGVAPGAIVGCSIWAMFGLLYVAAIFTQPEADITAPGSGYPNHLFILPVRTRELVLWPMVYGGLSLAAGWFMLAGLVMNRPPVVAPFLWPAAMLVAILASLQALFWTPMRFPTARIFIAIGLLGALTYFGAANPYGLAEWKLSLVFAGVVAAAFGVAVRGVACARMSAQAIRVPRESVSARIVTQKAAFRTPQRAQFWYEFRRGGMVLPVITLMICVLSSVPIFFEQALGSPYYAAPVVANLYVMVYLGALLRALPFIAWILGGAVWISGARASALSLPAFIAMRPLSSIEMAAARLKARIASAGIAFGIMLVCALIWLMLSGEIVNPDTMQPLVKGPFLQLFAKYVSPQDFGLVGVYILLLLAITVRNNIVGQFAGLSGKPAAAYAYMATVYAGPVMAFSMLSVLLGRGITPNDWALGFGIALGMKAVAAAFVARALLARGLAPPKRLACMLGLWGLGAFAMFEVMNYIVSNHTDVARMFGFVDLQGAAATSVVLLMACFWTPFARLAATPLMLEINRRGAK